MNFSIVWSLIVRAAAMACFWPFFNTVELVPIAAQVNPMRQGQSLPEYCPDGLHPHPTDCQLFLNCAHGRPHVQQCGPGTIFSRYGRVCVWPNAEECPPDITCEPCHHLHRPSPGYYPEESYHPIDADYTGSGTGYRPGEEPYNPADTGYSSSGYYPEGSYNPAGTDYSHPGSGYSAEASTGDIGYVGQSARRF